MVRIKSNKNFYVCSTKSGEGTNAKFDYTDPEQCQICVGFNPFVQEGIEGEQLENDNEPSKDEEDEEPDNKRTNDNNNQQNNNQQTQ